MFATKNVCINTVKNICIQNYENNFKNIWVYSILYYIFRIKRLRYYGIK